MMKDDKQEPNDNSRNTIKISSVIESLSSYNINASQYLFMATLPFAAGTYLGYRRSIVKAGKMTAGVTEKQVVAQAPIIAAKALGIGTLASVTGVGLIVSGIMFSCGASNVSELIDCWKKWQPPKIFSDLKWDKESGMREAEQLESDIINVKNLDEDAELKYITNKYFGEDSDEDSPKL